jgi:tocopherol cyclase
MFTKWKPAVFQGSLKKKNYFEGWYFKAVDKSEENALAIIPGISLTGNDNSHAFIMVLEARKQKLHYFSFSPTEFKYSKDKFELQIGDNFFSHEKMILNLNGEAQIKARFEFQNIIPWPVTLFSPGVMGWYSFIPFLECYHGVLSFNHEIKGYIEINGEKKDFEDGKGYMEKDWGSSMPSSWIWMQTNHFSEDGISLFGSIANIPWLGNFFTGYIFGFLYRNHLYQFTTYNGAKIKDLTLNDHHIKIEVTLKKYRLIIEADRTEGVDLPAPSLGEMTSKVNESLKSLIKVKLYEGEELLFSGEGRNAGLEFVGDIQELLKGLKK